MTMKTASRYMTPCEVLRQINDLCQDDNEKDRRIRGLLSKFEILAKKLACEVNKRPGPIISDAWWEKNTLDWRELGKMRMDSLYKHGEEPMKVKIKRYILELLNEDTNHMSSCSFPEGECTCKRPKDIGYGVSLLRGGYIDSFTVETIVVFLEIEFHVEIPPEQVKEENFDTIEKMVKLINTLK